VERHTAIDLRLEAVVDAPGRARQRLRELDGELSRARADEVRLLVSELVTNAVMHAGPGGEIRLRVELAPDRVRVEVRDRGRGFRSARPPPPPPPGQPHGRGLHMVDQVAERWGNARTDEGHCVWFELGRR
jgi:anti-sigma regulatory factor (Ser/Thr protein kinase)